mgnify:CR=1 FL=1
MAKVAKRRGRNVLDYYDNHGKRISESLTEGTTLKKAKEKMREKEALKKYTTNFGMLSTITT